ncbi:MAG: hypothetical protein ABRQ37_03380 [Candidatus Eremiobacterota bacterium]
MRKITVLIVVFLNILLAGCGDDNSVNPGNVSVTLSGKVMNFTTREAVSGAVLTSSYGNSVTSDSQGNFSFTFNSNSNYIITLSKEGYKGTIAGGFISTANINHNIYMNPLNNEGMPVIEDIQ